MADVSRPLKFVEEKVPRYRASCDSCNEAKVRCSQTRPSCARCLKSQNRRCIYGVSKRSGKRGRNSRMKAEEVVENGTMDRNPTPPTSTTGIPTPASSSSTIDPREVFQLFPASNAEPSDLLKEQELPKPWTFDNQFALPTQPTVSRVSPANADHYQWMFGRNESHNSNIQHHGLGFFDGASDAELGSSDHDDSVAEETLPYTQLHAECASCSTLKHPNDDSSIAYTCRCNKNIITQLSSLPVLLLDNERFTFDVELVQLQKAIKFCAGTLACTCPGKDYTSILTISMFIARIISVFECGGAQAGRRDNQSSAPSLTMTDAMTPLPSPKFSLGLYEVEEEDESNLRREVWWIQIKKVESLIAAFKAMVAKMLQQQVYQDASQTMAWEKLSLVLEQKVKAVKRDWKVYRDRD